MIGRVTVVGGPLDGSVRRVDCDDTRPDRDPTPRTFIAEGCRYILVEDGDWYLYVPD